MPIGQAVLPIGKGLPIQLQHVRSARLRVFALEAADLEAAARVTGWHEQGSDPVASLPANVRAREQLLRPSSNDGDEDGVQEVDVFAAAFTGARAGRSGPVLVVLDAPGVDPKVTVVQRADVGVVLKAGRGGGLAWVTDGATGAPIGAADVTVYDGERVKFRGRTRADGVVMLPARAQLEHRAPARAARAARAVAHDDEEEGGFEDGEFEGGDFGGGGERPLRAVVVAGNRTAFTSTSFGAVRRAVGWSRRAVKSRCASPIRTAPSC
jgi:hypothetical protein